MKTADLIVQYLYSNKSLTLQDIGSFTLSEGLNISAENDKEVVLPPDAIHFTFDPRAPQDSGLVSYIMEQTGKIRPLASSDLESYIMLNKQFLNIGKPLNIDGVGTLLKTQVGEYSFTQAGSSLIRQQQNEESPRSLKEKLKDDKDISFSTPQKEKKGAGKGVYIFFILLGLLIGGAAAFYFINKKDKTPVAETNNNSVVDTLPSAKPDTAQKTVQVSPAPVSVLNVKDSSSFYLVIHQFNELAAAQRNYDRLKAAGTNVVLYTADSVTYKIRMPFNRPLSDTSVVRDSIFKSKYFRVKMTVDLPR